MSIRRRIAKDRQEIKKYKFACVCVFFYLHSLIMYTYTHTFLLHTHAYHFHFKLALCEIAKSAKTNSSGPNISGAYNGALGGNDDAIKYPNFVSMHKPKCMQVLIRV